LRTLFISLACVAALFSAQPANAAPVSRVAAVVNGDMISTRELERACKPEFVGQQIDPVKDAAKADAIRKAVLEQLVTEKILLQQAAKDGIEISESELDAATERVLKESRLEREAFFKQLQKEGVTEKQFRDKLRFQNISQRLMNRNVVSKVVVTEEEVNEFFRKNMKSFVSGKVRVALIVYPNDVNAAALASDIAKGRKSFAEVARAVSIGPNPEGGGDMGFMALDDMAPGMVQYVSRMKKGDVSPVIDMSANKAQIALLDVEEAELPDAADAKPDEETAKRIEQILRGPRLQERFKQYTEQLRSRALVDIRI